ncbi:DNA replication and repair protein RecF [Saccharicrinis carchari]|uniref:DNA replication and repair protein RecF n=1 Tax=Saccharicrinis carchari TaxID=1168039 RepID=A0A521AVZ7_SACCC|nr:DNA replication/repair protein RecF [Saccharicrinis carchari]SMO38964.1 DNA replication and repair protein RecF [Saccharicrinis carchari]
MFLKHLHLINFKNIELAQLDLCKGINCLIGSNGAGKTNLLDAIYYMSFCKSFFNPVDSQNIRHNQDFFVVQGTYHVNNEEEHIYCGVKNGVKKQFKRNKKEYDKLSDHIGLLPLVVISPQDERLIVEGSEQRRRYVDGVISQYDKTYLEQLINYNKIISQRNLYLKKLKVLNPSAHDMLDIWDYQMIELGKKIVQARTRFLEELKPVFLETYNFISGQKEEVEFVYKSHLKDKDFKSHLKNARERDMLLGYSTKGVHKDDVDFKIGAYPIKKMGSQGQKKTFLIALKLGQFKFLSKYKKKTPILLLDDIFDKLDTQRGDKLIELVGGDCFRQIFITDTQINRIQPILKKIKKESRIFMVDNGAFDLI